MTNAGRPDILLVISDQMVPFLTGAYGHPVVRTPHLSALVAAGVRFDTAYTASPVCGPARSCLMTGRHASCIGAWDNAAPLPSDEITIPHYLTLAGYDTVLAGKMHFVGADQLHGFHRRLTTDIYPAEFGWTPVRDAARPVVKGHARDYVGEAVRVGRWSQYLSYDEETHFRALEYLRAKGVEREDSRAEGSPPFFLCVSYHHPHEPFWPPRAWWDLYEDAPIDVPSFPAELERTYSALDLWLNTFHGTADQPALRDPASLTRVRRAYYALVSYVDDKLGELMAVLAESGLADGTLVVFCSDHGDMLGEKGMVQKRTFYEWSARVPLIVRFPDGLHAGCRVGAPVSLLDLLPTFLDLAGVGERAPCDGTSLLAALAGEAAETRTVFAEYHAQGVHAPCFMARRGRHKYIHVHRHDAQLFDLAADPGEWRNLVREPTHEGLAAELAGAVAERFDAAAIDAAVTASIRRRQLIRRAMAANGTRWDHAPTFDATRPILRQYLR